MDYAKESLKMHYELKGKIEVVSRAKVDSSEALSLAYTPGVATPCLEIQKDVNKSFELTRRWEHGRCRDRRLRCPWPWRHRSGSRYAGHGRKNVCCLRNLAVWDAIPLCIRSHDVDEIVNTVRLLAGSFGGVNLEDISAPRCFEIEKKIKRVLRYPDLPR